MKSELPNSLISIIVPAYNVERYVGKCLESIFNQVHKNIEVIVINDGSTDSTGSVVDACVQNESRARVIHTQNQGVSAARNIGIRESTGEFLVFVDGDDYIAVDFVTYMLELVEKSGSEFCISKSSFTRSQEKQTKVEKVEILDTECATELLLSPGVIVGCWNKIYKRSLLISNGIWFSTSLFYGEGLTFITDVAQVCETVGVGNRKVYYYRKNNEVSATTKFDISKIQNGERALVEIGKRFPAGSKKICSMFNYHLCLYRLAGAVKLKSYGLDGECSGDYSRWLSFVRANSLKFIFNRRLSFYRKFLIIAGCISPGVLAKLDNFRRQRIINNSVDG